MLGIAGYLAAAEGIGWALYDTDSFAQALPEGMSDAELLERAERARNWCGPRSSRPFGGWACDAQRGRTGPLWRWCPREWQTAAVEEVDPDLSGATIG